MLDEEDYPFPRKQRDPVFDWDDFYAEISPGLKKIAKDFLKKYQIKYEWVMTSKEQTIDALQYAPLQVTVRAWYKNDDGLYYNNDNVFNHAVVLVGYETNKHWIIFDSYEPYIKKLEWNYRFGNGALKYYLGELTKENMWELFRKLFKQDNDLKLIRNSQTGEMGWFYADALRIPKKQERKTEMLLNYLHRTDRGITLSQEDWDKLNKVEF